MKKITVSQIIMGTLLGIYTIMVEKFMRVSMTTAMTANAESMKSLLSGIENAINLVVLNDSYYMEPSPNQSDIADMIVSYQNVNI